MMDFFQSMIQGPLQEWAFLPTWFWVINFALFGLIWGSFINVVVYRLPVMWQRMEENYIAEKAGLPLPHTEIFNLNRPRSRCPKCGHLIAWYDNIPVLSYLILKGKCRYCHTSIAWRYPMVELVSGLLCVFCVVWYGIGFKAVIFSGLALALWTLTLIDWDTQMLPDEITLPLVWLGLLINLDGYLAPLSSAVTGAMVGYLSLWTVNTLFRLIRGMDGMGYGDFKLLAALGAWFGWQVVPFVVLVASVVGTLYAGLAMLSKNLQWQQKFAFGPFIALAGGLLIVLYKNPSWWHMLMLWNY